MNWVYAISLGAACGGLGFLSAAQLGVNRQVVMAENLEAVSMRLRRTIGAAERYISGVEYGFAPLFTKRELTEEIAAARLALADVAEESN